MATKKLRQKAKRNWEMGYLQEMLKGFQHILENLEGYTRAEYYHSVPGPKSHIYAVPLLSQHPLWVDGIQKQDPYVLTG